MSDENIKDQTGDQTTGEESFAAMLEDFEDVGRGVSVGDRIRGKIIAIEGENVFVETGTKVDGVVEKSELLDKDGELANQIGDEVELYVVEERPGLVRLSKAVTGEGGLAMLSEAHQNHLPVEGKVVGTVKGGFRVEVLHRRAFCPISQIDINYVENAEEFVGQSFEFLVTRLEEGGRNIVVSRRALLERARAEAAERFVKEIQPGEVIEGTVARLAPFGAFVELAPGLDGLVHVSELSWGRVDDPAQVVSQGQTVQAKVLSVEPGDKGKLRISLSVKQAQADPWESVMDSFSEGQKLTGKVTRTAPFGAFVELAPGIEGLVHLSEFSYAKRVHKAEDEVQPGQDVDVVIKSIEPDKRRISLSIKDAEGDPWLDVPEKFQVGSEVEGTMEKRENFGWFVNLAPGITGLIPGSAAGPKSKDELNKQAPGSPVQVRITNVDAGARRISLAPAGEEPREDTGAWREHVPSAGSGSGGGGGFGSLGDKLRAAMKNKS